MTTWPTKKLGEVAEVIMGQSPPSSSYNERGEGLPFFQGKAEFGEIYPTAVKYCSSPSRIAEGNDILISVRAPVGNINIAREKSCVGRGLGALRAKKNILNQMFLFYFMKKNENNWSRLSTGSTFSAIKGSSLKNFEISLPPLKLQKQIVERMDKIAEARKMNDELIQKSEELFQSLLHKEFNFKTGEWKQIDLNKLTDFFQDGNWIESDDQSLNGIRLIQTGNIGMGEYIDKPDGARYISEETFIRLKCTEVFPGDILISRLPDPVGRSCLMPDLGTKMITAVDCTIVRFNKKKIMPEYFVLYSSIGFYYAELRKHLTGSSRQRVSRSNLGKTKILVAPLKTQKQIVSKLSAVQEYKKQLLAQKSKLKELFESVLDKSMKGEMDS